MNPGIHIVQCIVAAFAVFATASASDDASAPDAANAPSVQINVSIVEVASTSLESATSDQPEAQSVNGKASDGQTVADDESSKDDADSETLTVTDAMQVQTMPDGWRLRVGDQSYVVTEGRLKAEDERMKSGGLNVIASPSMCVRVGEQASITIGQAVSYMEKLENGDLRLVVKNDCIEGVELQALVSEAADDLVKLEKLSVSLKTIAGREPIEGVPFDVGRPIIRTREVSCSLRMAKGYTAVVPLPVKEKQSSAVLLLISMRVIPETPATP